MYSTLSPLIQASLTPVFMLSAIGVTLSIVDTRLNRIVDRLRLLEDRIDANLARADDLGIEVDFFMRRARQVGRAAALCTLAALCVVLSVVALFIDVQVETPLALVVEATFTCAVLSYGLALVLYLRDVFMVYRGLGFTQRRVAASVAAARSRPD